MLFLCSGSSTYLPDRRSAGIQTEGTVTVVTVGNPPNTHSLTNHMTGSITSSSLSSSNLLTQYCNASTSTREINFPISAASGSSLMLASQHHLQQQQTPLFIQQPLTSSNAITLSAASVSGNNAISVVSTTNNTIYSSNVVPAKSASKHSIRFVVFSM